MIFLRFPDEQTYLSAIEPYTDAEGNCTIPHMDVIGLIYEGGEWDEEGNVITPPVAIYGWHANLPGPDVPEGLESYVIDTPSNPRRIFQGWAQELVFGNA